jgi:hypothetical protein
LILGKMTFYFTYTPIQRSYNDAYMTTVVLNDSDNRIWVGISGGTILFVDLATQKQTMYAHHRCLIVEKYQQHEGKSTV